jgi:hypothetical protein
MHKDVLSAMSVTRITKKLTATAKYLAAFPAVLKIHNATRIPINAFLPINQHVPAMHNAASWMSLCLIVTQIPENAWHAPKTSIVKTKCHAKITSASNAPMTINAKTNKYAVPKAVASNASATSPPHAIQTKQTMS